LVILPVAIRAISPLVGLGSARPHVYVSVCHLGQQPAGGAGRRLERAVSVGARHGQQLDAWFSQEIQQGQAIVDLAERATHGDIPIKDDGNAL
jgi:hypothetical protein